jgi:hypothetical protein
MSDCGCCSSYSDTSRSYDSMDAVLLSSKAFNYQTTRSHPIRSQIFDTSTMQRSHSSVLSYGSFTTPSALGDPDLSRTKIVWSDIGWRNRSPSTNNSNKSQRRQQSVNWSLYRRDVATEWTDRSRESGEWRRRHPQVISGPYEPDTL